MEFLTDDVDDVIIKCYVCPNSSAQSCEMESLRQNPDDYLNGKGVTEGKEEDGDVLNTLHVQNGAARTKRTTQKKEVYHEDKTKGNVHIKRSATAAASPNSRRYRYAFGNDD
ncbi:hypothetical protein C0Q70_06825 [Pomacea canaliculata]|uniref:Uncharacterized protein n=1 Tax=Pomacea canaliculata TaxID=400727 RepID=A0A2T7PDB6_POMCA|nr:hypothetical protein C0Q70_06825 [Pomacea canaliculata]